MSASRLEERIAERLGHWVPGARLLRTWPLSGGISATMVAFEFERTDGERCRWSARQPNEYRYRVSATAAADEFRVLQALEAAGLTVPKPILVESEGEERSFFVLEFVEGAVEASPTDVDGYLNRYTRELVRIHNLDFERADLTFLPSQDIGYEPWPEQPNEDLREPEIRRMLESVPARTRSNPAVLRHGDFWPGNVLWRDGEIAAVIDWEEVLIGEPLADIAICRLDLWWILGREAVESFTAKYAALREIDWRDLAYWDLCASLRPITHLPIWAASFPSIGRPDVTVSTMARDHGEFVDGAMSRFDEVSR